MFLTQAYMYIHNSIKHAEIMFVRHDYTRNERCLFLCCSSSIFPQAQIPLGSSRLDKTRHDSTRSCRAHAFSLCRACRTARLDTLDTLVSTRSTRRTRRVETWRDEPNGI